MGPDADGVGDELHAVCKHILEAPSVRGALEEVRVDAELEEVGPFPEAIDRRARVRDEERRARAVSHEHLADEVDRRVRCPVDVEGECYLHAFAGWPGPLPGETPLPRQWDRDPEVVTIVGNP